MEKYHVNADGVPGKCRAKRSCPFGDLESDHYESKEAAAAGFEKKMQEQLLNAYSRVVTQENSKVKALQTVLPFMKEKLESVEDLDARIFFSSYIKRLSELDNDRQYSRLKYLIEDGVHQFDALGREDLAEVNKYMVKLLDASTQAEHWSSRIELLRNDLAHYNKEIAFYNEDLKEIETELQSKDLTTKEQEKLEFNKEEVKYLIYINTSGLNRVQAEYTEIEGKLARADEVQKELIEDINKTPLNLYRTAVQTEAKVYDDSNEYTIITPSGEEATVRKILSNADRVHYGRLSIAEPEAIKKVQEAADELLKLYSDEDGVFTLPEQNNAKYDENFTLLGSGAEVNAYLHKPTQMVYKIPHQNSVMFGRYNSNTPEENKKLVKHAVMMSKEGYVRVEDKLTNSEEDVDFLKTYFVDSKDSTGTVISVEVQPYLEPELYTPVHLDTFDKAFTAAVLAGAEDMHDGNVRMNKLTGRVLLVDCVWIDPAARVRSYVEAGVISGDKIDSRMRYENDLSLGSPSF